MALRIAGFLFVAMIILVLLAKGSLLGLVMLTGLVGLYFLPTFVANSRGHHRTAQVAVINALLGWTLLGWVFALVIAVGPVQPSARRSA